MMKRTFPPKHAVSGPISHNDPMLKNYVYDLVNIFNAVVDTLPGDEGKDKPRRVNVDTSQLNVIECMQLIRALIKDFVLIYQQLANLYKALNDEYSFKSTESYVIDLNEAGEVLYRKFVGFLGSAFAMRTREDDLRFVTQNDLFTFDLEELRSTAEFTFGLVNEMAHIFYGEAEMPVTITYREDGWGEGCAYDNMMIQEKTGRPTVVSVPKGSDASHFIHYLEKHPQFIFPHSVSFLAEGSYDSHDMATLVVPGFSSASLPLNERPQPLKKGEYEKKKRLRIHEGRVAHEVDLLHQVKRDHATAVTICGGTATLARAFGGDVEHLPPEKKNKHNKPMVRISSTGKLPYTKPAHAICVKPGTQLDKYFHEEAPRENPDPSQPSHYDTHSAHWFSISEVPDGFITSAVASFRKKDGGYHVDDRVIEAIENNLEDPSEAAIIGLQGHFESMWDKNSSSLFRSLAREGDRRHKLRISKANKPAAQATLDDFLPSSPIKGSART